MLDVPDQTLVDRHQFRLVSLEIPTAKRASSLNNSLVLPGGSLLQVKFKMY